MIPVRRVIRDDLPLKPDDPSGLRSFIMGIWPAIKHRIPGFKRELAAMQRHEDMLVQRASAALLNPVKQHIEQYRNCKACELGQHPCLQQHVFYRGYVPADVLFVSAAPGLPEDTVGIPVVGRLGVLLDQIMYDAYCSVFHPDSFPSFRWCITCAVSCIPVADEGAKDYTRAPKTHEAKACRNRLEQFIRFVQPRIIVSLGPVAERFTPRNLSLKPIPLTRAQFLNESPTPTWQPHSVTIRDPEFIDKQSDIDLETRRAVLLLSNAFKKYLT